MKMFLQSLAFFLLFVPSAGFAEVSATRSVRIGVIASLSGFAANYGRAVLEGAEVGVAELKRKGVDAQLIIEDDASEMKQTVTAYHRLRQEPNLVAIVGGSWWLQSVVPLAERDGLPLFSCETVFNDQTIRGRSYFILSGYLAPWLSPFRPLLDAAQLRTAAVIRSGSGFGRTLGRATKELFSESGRSFLGELEYDDLDAQDVRSLVLKLSRLKPDVVYIDAHPGGLANILRRMSEQHLHSLYVFTNSIARDMKSQNLFDTKEFPHIYFNDRERPDSDFRSSFLALHGKEPRLNADLGYYSVFLAKEIAGASQPLERLQHEEFVVQGKSIRFDANNVWRGPSQMLLHLE